jgi:hypothetical protein
MLGFEISNLRLFYDVRQLDGERRIEEYGITEDDQILGYRVWLGKEPVIYVLSPSVMDVTVSLHLVPEWSFSSIYPSRIPRTLSDGGQKIEWRVTTQENGKLTDQDSGVEVSYLYWEAQFVFSPIHSIRF